LDLYHTCGHDWGNHHMPLHALLLLESLLQVRIHPTPYPTPTAPTLPPTLFNMMVNPIRRWRSRPFLFCFVHFRLKTSFIFLSICQAPQTMGEIYNNEYSLIINIYFNEILSTQTSSACTPKTFLDTLSDILDKFWRFSLIKIKSVSEMQANPHLVSLSHLLYIFFY